MSAPGDNVSGGTLSGRELAGYRLLHVLGTGGASEVYLAQRLDDPSALVAIKVLMPSWHLPPGERTAFYARFVREAQAAQRLSHRHILPVLGFGEDGDTTYMVLPFMAGGTLVTQLANAPRGLPLAQAAADLAQIADALDYAHAQGVVHRDIKPTNVLVDEKGQLYLADFGIARLFDPGEGGSAKAGSQPLTTLTVTGQVLGTPIYMAPEQLLSARVGPEADLYALGVLLYQLVTGAVPFQAETPLGLAMQHVQEPPPPPRLRRGDLPEPAEAAMLRALAKAPQERFASAGAFARAFAAGLRGQWSEGLFPGAHSSATPSTVVATPPPTIVATPPPTPYSASPYRSGPYSAPVYPQPYAATPPSYALPTRPRSSTMPVVLTIVAVIAVIALVFSAQAAGMLHLGGAPSGGNSTPSQSLTPGSASAANPPTPLVPVGQMLYYTAAAGPCDTNGASWAQNNQASESCQSGAFVMSAPECDCAIGVAALSSLPGKSLPDSYVVQVSAENVGNISSAKFGFKFRQQSVQDSGDGRGGYSFLVDPSGQWQFNRYDANGKRNIVDQEQLPAPVQGANTLDLVVSGATYSFYMGGHVITTQTDSNYASGFFCLAIEPGATVYFRDLAMYARQ